MQPQSTIALGPIRRARPCGAVLLALLFAGGAARARSGDVGLDRLASEFNERFGLVSARDASEQFLVLAGSKADAQLVAARAWVLKRGFDRSLRAARVWDRPTIVIIYPDEDSYRKDFVDLPGTDGGSVLTRWRAQPLRVIGTFVQDRILEEILPHEMVHLLVKDLAWSGVQTHGRKVPLWIDEGLAVALTSSAERRARDDALVAWAMRAGQAFSFQELVAIEKYPQGEAIRVFYAQCHSITAFLLDQPGGIDRVRTLIQYTNGAVTDRLQQVDLAFRGQFSGHRALAAAWLSYLDAQLRARPRHDRPLTPERSPGPTAGTRPDAARQAGPPR